MDNTTIKSRSVGLYATMMIGVPIISTILFIIGLISIMTGAFAVIGIIGYWAAVIYGFVLWYGVVRDINIMCEGDGEHLYNYIVAMLLSLITLGIYGLYYFYRIQTRLHENGPRYHRNISESGGTYLLWMLLGSLLFGIGSIVAPFIVFKSFNKLVDGYNCTSNKAITGDVAEMNGRYSKDLASDSDMTVPVKSSGLLCKSGQYQGGSFDITQGEVLSIGRDMKTVNIVLKDESVSRTHCILYFRGNQIILQDYSMNGTLVNGKKIEKEKEYPLHQGDRIQIGNSDDVFIVK